MHFPSRMTPRRGLRIALADMNLILTVAFLSVAGILVAPASLRAQATPVGRWDAISDVTHKPDAIVDIRDSSGTLIGVITALLDPADDTASVCDQCSGPRKGQRVLGMEILSGMRASGNGWSGGEILDPDTGKTYKAEMRLADGGRQLVVRGYIGLRMFGRSQTWVRDSSAAQTP